MHAVGLTRRPTYSQYFKSPHGAVPAGEPNQCPLLPTWLVVHPTALMSCSLRARTVCKPRRVAIAKLTDHSKQKAEQKSSQLILRDSGQGIQAATEMRGLTEDLGSHWLCSPRHRTDRQPRPANVTKTFQILTVRRKKKQQLLPGFKTKKCLPPLPSLRRWGKHATQLCFLAPEHMIKGKRQ